MGVVCMYALCDRLAVVSFPGACERLERMGEISGSGHRSIGGPKAQTKLCDPTENSACGVCVHVARITPGNKGRVLFVRIVNN